MLNIIEIKNTIDALLEKHNIKKEDLCQENGNYIYYMNGNDGTDFDATMNDMTCEFYAFYKETEYGAVKLNLINSDEYRVFVYDKNNSQEVLEKNLIKANLSFEETCAYLQGTFDDCSIFDKAVVSWELDKESFISFEDEEDEDDDYYEDEYYKDYADDEEYDDEADDYVEYDD